MADPRDEKIADLERVIEAQRGIAQLMARVAELEARLAQNSSNSGKPPSSDPPGKRDERLKPKASGQSAADSLGTRDTGELLPPEAVTATEEHFPEKCAACKRDLPRRPCDDPIRHQVVEVPPMKPDVTEHRQHAVQCECGHVTRARFYESVPLGMCGPRLVALIGLLTGAYHVSRRSATNLLSDLLGVRIALGTLSESEERVSDALAAPVQEALDHALRARVKHVDATGWRQSGKARSLWTIATTLVTVFAITLDGTRDHLREVLTAIRGILVSDRAPQFAFWAMHMRQICWAHLLRKFVAFTEDKQPEVAKLGEHLLFFGHLLFHQWHRVRDGTLSRAAFRRDTMALRTCVENLLQQGVDLRLRGVSGSCADILAHREALWTFIDTPGVEPTNNHGEPRGSCLCSLAQKRLRVAE